MFFRNLFQPLLYRYTRIRRNLVFSVKLGVAASRILLIKYTVLGMVSSCLPPAGIWLSAELVDMISQGHTGTKSSVTVILLLLWLIFMGQKSIAAYIANGKNLYVRNVELEAERILIQKASDLDYEHFDDPEWYDRMARAKRDVSWRPADLTWSILGLSGNVVTLILMVGMLASLHYVLLILTLVSAFFSLLIEGKISSRLYQCYYHETPEERERQYVADLFVQPRTNKEIKAYGLADYLLARHKSVFKRLNTKRGKVFQICGRLSILSGIIGGSVLAAAYVFVSYRGLSGDIKPGAILLVINAFSAISSSLAIITSTIISMDQHSTFLDDYFAFISLAPSMVTKEAPVDVGPIEKIELISVSYQYAKGGGSVIDNLNLKINKGQLIAILGENGSGKSTLVKLLLRFYDVCNGCIYVNGTNIKDLNPLDLRKKIGVLFQDFATYDFTIKENILMGWPYGEVDERRMALAVKCSKSERLIKKFEKGLESQVGRLFDGGHDLSGGEWQRLALARIFNRGADVWILDELTSAMDPAAEIAIFQELKENLKGRIGIIISHRFSTVRLADRIAVMEKGNIVEFGSHEELLRMGKVYAQLFQQQATGYR